MTRVKLLKSVARKPFESKRALTFSIETSENKTFWTFSFIIEGAAEKVSQFRILQNQITNKTLISMNKYVISNTADRLELHSIF